MYLVLLHTTKYFIMTAVLGCAASHVKMKCCDCVLHGREVWIGVLMCNLGLCYIKYSLTLHVLQVNFM